MQSYEDAPPPYPGTASNAASNVVTSKGDYRGVPVYEMGSGDAPVYNPMAYQQAPVMPAAPVAFESRPVQVGNRPLHCICPQCHQQIMSRVDHESGSFAWLMCLLLTVIGCVPCCVIPFCATSCQDVTHRCPYCSAVVGRRKIL